MAKGNSARLSDGNSANEDCGIVTLELALEEAVKLGVLRGGPAILHTLRRGLFGGKSQRNVCVWGGTVEETCRVAGLLRENLGKLDHGRIVVEGLGEINLTVGGILLRTGSGCCKKSAKGRDRHRVALLATTSGEL